MITTRSNSDSSHSGSASRKFRASSIEMPTILVAASYAAIWLLWPAQPTELHQNGARELPPVVRFEPPNAGTALLRHDPTLFGIGSTVGFSRVATNENVADYLPVPTRTKRHFFDGEPSFLFSQVKARDAGPERSVGSHDHNASLIRSLKDSAPTRPDNRMILSCTPAADLSAAGFRLPSNLAERVTLTNRAWNAELYIEVSKPGKPALFFRQDTGDAQWNRQMALEVHKAIASTVTNPCEGRLVLSYGTP